MTCDDVGPLLWSVSEFSCEARAHVSHTTKHLARCDKTGVAPAVAGATSSPQFDSRHLGADKPAAPRVLEQLLPVEAQGLATVAAIHSTAAASRQTAGVRQLIMQSVVGAHRFTYATRKNVRS